MLVPSRNAGLEGEWGEEMPVPLGLHGRGCNVQEHGVV